MKHFNIFCLSLFCIASLYSQGAGRRKNVGIFRQTDPVLSGIIFGNWGSRPYEYYWVSTVVPIQDKYVIDLGVGLPSQYNWYEYVIKKLSPAFYVGIDFDSRIINESQQGVNFEIKHMNMTVLRYPDKIFDIAYCISTFEHMLYMDFLKAIAETHRALKDDGYLIITLDEKWDKNQPVNHDNGWNTLEQSVQQANLLEWHNRSFGLPEFLFLIQDYFVLGQEDAVVNIQEGTITSVQDGYIYYDRVNRDPLILNSGLPINSCVSYAVLKKIKR